MRGDAGLTARLLVRGAGFAGVVTTVGGVLAVVGAFRPWRLVVAEVSMLGDASARTVVSVPGVPDTVGGWSAAGLGVVVVALGTSLALDRAPPRGRLLAGVAALLLGVVGALAALTVPDTAAVAGQVGHDLRVVGAHLPVGVDLTLRASTGSGPVWVLVGATAAITGAASAQDR